MNKYLVVFILILALMASVTAITQDEEILTIGYAAPGFDPAQEVIMNGVVNYAEPLGWQIVTRDSGGSEYTQARQIKEMIALPVNAIIAVPVDSETFCASVALIEQANIRIYTIDRAPIGCTVNMTVQADNYLGGQQSAEAIIDYLTEKYGKPSGTVLELQGDMDTNVAQLRSEGFNDVMAEHEAIEVVSINTEWDGNKFYHGTLDVVGAQPIDAIFAHTDTVVDVILKALDLLDKKIPRGETGHIFLATIDGTPECLDNIRLGFQDQCSSQPFPDFGILVNYIELERSGETIEPGIVEQADASWSPATIMETETGLMLNLATTSVTEENVDDPGLWGNAEVE